MLEKHIISAFTLAIFMSCWGSGIPCSSRIIRVFTPDPSLKNNTDVEDPSRSFSALGDSKFHIPDIPDTELFESSPRPEDNNQSDGTDRNVTEDESECSGPFCETRERKHGIGNPEIPFLSLPDARFPDGTKRNTTSLDPELWNSSSIPNLPSSIGDTGVISLEDIPDHRGLPGLGGILGGSSKPHCISYGTCDLAFLTSCPSDQAPVLVPPDPTNPNAQIAKMLLLCPHLLKVTGLTYACCENMQMLTQNGLFLTQTLALTTSCVPCGQNLVKLFCHMNCGPQQSLHSYVLDKGTDPLTQRSTVESIRFYVTDEYARKVFNSCRDVKSLGVPLQKKLCHAYGTLKCGPSLFFEGMGLTKSIFPIKVSFAVKKKDKPFNVTFDGKNVTYWPLNSSVLDVASCHEGNLIGIPPAPSCSCENCRKACPKTTRRPISFGKPKLPDFNQFLPQNIPARGFWGRILNYVRDHLWLLYSIQALGMVTTFIFITWFGCYAMNHVKWLSCERSRKRIWRIRHREWRNRYRFWQWRKMYLEQKAIDDYKKQLARYNEQNYCFNNQPGYNSEFRGYGDNWRLGIDLKHHRVWIQNSQIKVGFLREDRMIQENLKDRKEEK
ncbi:hypothetical protein HHI36_014596 [Cryptolaemus montrouzieri]|uniref:Niemann-Pick C1 N-terminal domain-containing protein n=1 Tax=Cryptolaemus montrouzieri TaxID=559131 RepID=A0ABD2N3P9_9CUCU